MSTKRRFLPFVALIAALIIAGFTQLTELTEVPGLHFDEAWQGLYAQRIAFEPGFWPLSAMNSYTSPVLHYGLAIAFKFFGPSLIAMRGFFAILNFLTLGLILILLSVRHSIWSAVWFALLWAVLPLSVHLHRFYIEMNSFFAFCFALILWSLHLWKTRPKTACILMLFASFAGAYSHVLFIASLLGLFAVVFRRPSAWTSRASVAVLSGVAIGVLPMLIRMSLTLHNLSSWILVVGFAITPLAIKVLPKTLLSSGLHKSYRWALLVCIPFLFAYLFLFWDGPFSYGQVTGTINGIWLPVNTLLFAFVAWRVHLRQPRENQGFSHDAFFLWKAFIFSFLASSVMILKQSPRYYMIPTLLLMACAALELAAFRNRLIKVVFATVLVTWNLFLFIDRYVAPFQTNGATAQEFHCLIFKDSARDFRPFQKVYTWLENQGCGPVIRGVEDDRFLRPIEFMQLTPSAHTGCPWTREQLAFRSIPQKREDIQSNLELMSSRPEWGDLGIWIVKK